MTTHETSAERGAPYSPDSSPAPDDAPRAPAAKTPLWEDFIDILYAPSEVYARRAASGFWAPMLILALLSGLIFLATRGTLEPIMDAEFQRSMQKSMEQNPQITAEMAEKMRGFANVSASVAAFVGLPVLMFLVGLVSWGVSKLFDAQQSLRATIMVVAYAYVPKIIESVVVAVQGLLLDTSAMDGRYRITLGAARFLDPDTTPALTLALLGRLDLFTLWVTALIGIGLAVTGRIPRSRAFVAALIVWVLGALPGVLGALRG